MEKITEKKAISVKKEIDIEMYKTNDGKTFSKEEDAIKHEYFLKTNDNFNSKYKLKEIRPDEYGINYSDLVSANLLFIEKLDEQTKNDLMWKYPYLRYDGRRFDAIKYGWSIFIEEQYDSCGLSRWSGYWLYIHSVEELIEEKNQELLKLKEIIK